MPRNGHWLEGSAKPPARSTSMAAPYDQIAPDYADFVTAALEDPEHILTLATESLLHQAGDVRGLRVCDLGCGEGHLARRLAARGAHVTAIDNSQHLLELAAQRTQGLTIEYSLDDAQRLVTLPESDFDLVVSNFSLMDIPDLSTTCAAVFRVLKPGGRFVFSITHPCFQLPRVTQPDGTEEADSYFHEGFWASSWKAGIRGRVGAQHRTLSTYLNQLTQTGFTLRTLAEPRTAADPTPKVLLVDCAKR